MKFLRKLQQKLSALSLNFLQQGTFPSSKNYIRGRQNNQNMYNRKYQNNKSNKNKKNNIVRENSDNII